MSPGTPLTLCPVCGWHRQQHHCQGEWGAPSQRGQLACWLQPGKVDQTWVHPSSCSGWRSLREGRLAEASVQQIQHTSSSRPHTLGKPCMKPETPSNASRTQKQGCVPEVSSFLSICSGLPSLDATKCPSQDWCASPPLPDHCHWHERKASRLREPSEPQEDCSASPLQGNPSSWVYNTLCTIPSPARLIPASPVFHIPGQTIILCLEGVLSHRLEVFSLEWLLKMSQPNLVPSLSLKDLCLQ